MQDLGVKQYHAVIVSEEDFDRGKINPIPPPKGFIFERPEPIPDRGDPEPAAKVVEEEKIPDFPGGIDI